MNKLSSDESFKTIDLNKLLGDQILSDEKIVYIAKLHWIILIYIYMLLLMLLTFLVLSFITHDTRDLLCQPFFIFMLILSLFVLINYYSYKLILTNYRLYPIGAMYYLISLFFINNKNRKKNRGIFLNNIKADFFLNQGLLGSMLDYGSLIIHTKEPTNGTMRTVPLRNIKKLNLLIKEQVFKLGAR